MLFERSTHDVICIESTKLYSFPFHTFRAKKIYIYYREQAFKQGMKYTLWNEGDNVPRFFERST